ncbi:ABC transporter permease [Yersinia pestis]|nr:ABC transporter permease [Yersinia pestis]
MTKYSMYFSTFKNYYYLLTLLVKKDIKKKYKGSFLGILWSLFNPLLNMIVLTIVFSTVFKHNISHYPVYLLCGNLLFSFFSLSTTASMKSVINSAGLIKKIYVPKYMFTLAPIISNFVFFIISLLVLIILIIATKAPITIYILYSPVYLLLLLAFSCGVSLILATITVFFRDIEHIYGVLITALLYASAIFYPENIIPDRFRYIITFNPMYHFIKGFRHAVYEGVPIDLYNLLICCILATISLIIGAKVFEKCQDKFILYI